MACVKALEAANAQGISRIRIETDPSYLREALLSNDRDLEPSGMLLKYIREFWADHFVCSNISNIPRSCNTPAHELANEDRYGVCTGESMLWLDNIPDIVNLKVTRDYTEFSLINTTIQGPRAIVSFENNNSNRLMVFHPLYLASAD
jgi:hypothetical protein